MTAQVLETQAATELEAEALKGLSPEILKLAKSLGLFGLTVGETAEDILDAEAALLKKTRVRIRNRNALGSEIQQL